MSYIVSSKRTASLYLKRHLMDKRNKLQTSPYVQVGKSNQSEFDFIKDKPELVYLIKKLERIGSAVHIVTSVLSEGEPLRIALREECLLNVKNAILREPGKSAFTSIEVSILHSVSLLDMAKGSMIISAMNADVLKKEFLELLPVIQNIYSNERERLSFDEGELNAILEGDLKDQSFSSRNKNIKDTPDVLYKRHNIKDKSNTKTIGHSVNPDSLREKMILDILKNSGEVGIKDITSFMKGVSSKTIQRDLGNLVFKGVLKKSGERRWSRYSIV